MAPKPKLVAFHPVHGYKIKPPQDLKTIKRNERERRRVEVVNKGFETLRQHVPNAAPVKKMSKVGILNEAMEYIQYLKTVLVTSSSSSSEPVLLNYTQHIPYHHLPYHQSDHSHQSHQSHQPHQPHQPHHSHQPQSPVMAPQSQLISPAYAPGPSSDQGFVSDYSQASPGPAWHTPHHHQHHQVSQVSSSSHYQNLKYDRDVESSGDEDDILDAIAEWQQQ